MLKADLWYRDLNKQDILVFIVTTIILFIIYEYILFSRFLAERYLAKGIEYMNKADVLPEEALIEKSLAYQGALKLLKKSRGLNSLDARPFFEYGRVLAKIVDNPLLASSLEITHLDGGINNSLGFYNSAKAKYIEAILREPTNFVYHQALGEIYDKLSEPEKAEEEFKNMASLEPQNIIVHLYLSQYYSAKGKNVEFQYHLKKMSDLYKANPPGLILASTAEKVENFVRVIGREDLIRR